MNAPFTHHAYLADAAVESVIATGALKLIENPQRATYIIRRAIECSPRQLELACNRWLVNCQDFNKAIAFMQLRRAACTPEFAKAWDEYRLEMGATI